MKTNNAFSKKSHSGRNYQVNVEIQHFPLKSVFRIARGAKTQADVIVVTITDGDNTGWAESVPYGRYGESVSSVKNEILDVAGNILTDENMDAFIQSLPTGAARNALDCALWDLRAKQKKVPVHELLSLAAAQPCVTAQTLSIDTPKAMAKAVQLLDNPPLVKVKLDNQNIIEKMTAIQQAAPYSQFIVDANEGWSLEDLKGCCPTLEKLNVVLIEQPLPADKDEGLIDYQSPVPLCADESCHTRKELDYLLGRYQVINIKLDKTGGLTEAIALLIEAKNKGFDIMLGCMVGSSLAMAPASLMVNEAKYIDLDGPLLIAQDRVLGFNIEGGVMQPLNSYFWGDSSDANYYEAKSIVNRV
jgi:L-alanine-DL-glutamate epimerase-like enolase superfamily enzyme